MRLKLLCKGLPVEIRGSKEMDITGLSADSKRVAPGNLFIAKKGRNFDGALFIPEAVQNGAVAVLTDIYDPFLNNAVQILCNDLQAIEPVIAARFYHSPSDHLFLCGVTGTNGKTTTCYLIKHLFDYAGKNCGLMGTIETLIGNHSYFSEKTTADIVTNQKYLFEMVKEKCKTAVLEVTSHAIEQKRIEGLIFSLAVFTNFSQDHLDYHGTMDKYFEAKRKFFLSLTKKAKAIFNADEATSIKMMEGCQAIKLTYGIDSLADLMAKDLSFSLQGTTFTLCYQQKEVSLSTKLVGKFNVYNILAAILTALEYGISLAQITEALPSFKGVPGRLQRVVNSCKKTVFVDFSHTPDALKQVLKTLRELQKGKIITVFGCGGNRDASKRPLMARVAEEASDFTVVTSDNPRKEDPEKICQEVALGFVKRDFIIEVDRYKAIEKAIAIAEKNDMVLIAGKGHEKTQIFAHRALPFDDVEVAKALLTKDV